MSEENVNPTEEPEEIHQEEDSSAPPPDAPPAARRRFFTRRNFFISFAALASLVLLVVLAAFLAFRFGYFDNYVKDQFITKMDQMGITFSADVFRTTVAPMSLELGNATFIDKTTGEKLFYINSAKIGLTVTNLYSWQLSRDFKVDSTEIDGAEVWVKFDENGNSNFSNLRFAQEEGGFVNLNYTSANFSLKNGLIHFGDVQRKVSAEARNVVLALEPENLLVPEEQKRYRFDLASTNSVVVYNEKPIDPVGVHVRGLVYREGAEISELRLTSPVANSTLKGNIEGWDTFRYNFNIESSVDLMQAATFLPNGTALRGIGNFRGTLSGEGERYKIDDAEITADSLAADNIRLKALQINATVEGENSMYNANGKAIAEMLTFEDFRIDYPQLVGNVRGSGTDFKWVGELQAAAAKTPSGTLSGLFIRDAVAEYEDERFDANFGNVMARRFLSDDADVQNLQARNVKLSNFGDRTDIGLPNLRAGLVKVQGAEMRGVNAGNIKVRNQGSTTNVEAGNLRADNIRTRDAQLNGVNAGNIRLRNQGSTTNIQAGNLRAENLQTKDARLKNLSASGVNVSSRNGAIDARANNVQAGQVDASGARIGNLDASNVDARIRGNQTDVVAGNLKVARVETDAAILGSLNVAGVRLSIRNGRIEGSSGDIDAGNVTLTKAALPEGGTLENVTLAKPVFVLEPSGRYRASLDLSLGGGVLGSVRLGAARANVVATSDQVALTNLTAEVMDGNIAGDAVIAMNDRNQSRVDANFSNLDLGKLLALQGGQVVPIAGQTTGQVNLTFAGTNFRTANGSLTADFNAKAGTEERGLVPVTGKLGLRATNGLFDIDYANLNTEKSAFNATGRFDLGGSNSNLQLALDSSDASEIERLIKVLNLSPTLEEQLASNQVALGGNLKFNGTLTGNLENPTIDGRATLDSVAMRGRALGSLATNISVSPLEINLRDGVLQEAGGGNLAFNVNVPRVGTNNITVQATLNKVNTGNLLAALPVGDFLPEGLRDFQGETSGSINLSGLPNEIAGEVNLSSPSATVAGQTLDGFDARVTIQNSLATIEKFDVRFADGFIRAAGNYQTNTGVFNFNLEGKGLQLAKLRPLLSKDDSLPLLAGTIDLTAKATGDANNPSTFDINFNGEGREIVVNENALGNVSVVGNTVNQQLNASVTTTFGGNQQQVITANVNFADPNLPFRAETDFNQTELAPLLALASPPENVSVTGRATGRVYLEGNLYTIDAATGKRSFTTGDLKGEARFTQFSLLIGETPFIATDPLAVRFNTDAITIENAQFSGGGSNVAVSGSKALSNTAINNLAINGKVNLRVLDVLSKNTFFAGIADVAVRLTGANAEPRLTGTAALANASFTTFISSERISLNRINGRVIFNSDQAQIEQLTGYLGGGRITASGGALIKGLDLQRFRVDVRGQNVSAPLMEGFLATGDVELQVSGEKVDGVYNTFVAGNVNTRRAIYTKDIDLADIIGRRGGGSLGAGGGGGGSSSSTMGVTRLNLSIEARDSLIVRNNIADVTASASLRVTGDFEEPIILGRVTATGGTLLFRNDRYDIQRAVVEFPPQNNGAPFVNLQAETEIQGYQIVVSLVGDLSTPEALSAVVRSNPGLPQADVISLITTGSLANTGTGIPTLAQGGINTAAEILTDALINDPLRKATDKLFGLNRFEIDPIISGQRLNASARLTVGRQINRNLLVTYSTNLSEDQNQVLALEYRVSNRLSFVAQYEQRSLSNVTRNSNNFSFEVRLRKRF